VIKIQATFTGYGGAPCSLFSAYDPEARVLVVSVEAPYRTEREEGCVVLTNVLDIIRDWLFSDADLLPAIAAFQALRNGVAVDGKSSRLSFGDRAIRANPGPSIEQDGIEVSGPKYRINAGVSCAQIAALATCLYAVRSDAVERSVQMAESFRDLSRYLASGGILTI
jgi:hypothetical protein